MDKKAILVVEDEISLRSALSDKLNNEGFEVIIAKNGLEGIQEIKKKKPDLILLDVVMPIMDGLSMLREIKNDDKTKNIPVVILSNLGDQRDILKAMEHEAFDYLVKSDVTLEAIVAKIKSKLNMT
jgi:two-component system phosphate regulon response regulator PhoB